MDRGLIENTQNFGTRLKSAREQAGFNLETLARRLHIRPDIITSIEKADFDNMPAAGYAKNMIRSYARTVGLNQNEITELYISELETYERTEKHDPILALNNDYQRRSRRGSFLDLDSSRKDAERDSSNERRSHNSTPQPESSSRTRSHLDSRSKRPSRAYFSNAGTKNHVKTKSMQSTYTLGNAPRPSIPNFDPRKFVVPAIVIIIIVLLLMIFNLLLSNKNADSQDDVPAMPISGLTDTSNKDESASNTSTTTTVDHATFKVEVSSGQESWCTVTLDGTQSFADVISGPESKTFEVKGKLEFTTANSGPVKIYIDDKEQQMTADQSTGFYTFSYTFGTTQSSTSSQSSTTSTSTSNSAKSGQTSATSAN